MKRLVVGQILTMILLSSIYFAEGEAKGFTLCEHFDKTFSSNISSKIQTGIPFELMSAIFNPDGTLIQRIVIRVSFDLWEEIISLERDGKMIAKIPLREAKDRLCNYLSISQDKLPKKQKVIFRLLLNPLWEGSVARLKSHVSSVGDVHNSLLRVNWDQLSKGVSSEKILFEEEVSTQ